MKAPKTVFITGTSSGFGKLAVQRLLTRGHLVVCGVRGGEARLAETLPEEKQRYGANLRAVDLHLEQPASVAQAAAFVKAELGGQLDTLINNAGYGAFGSLEDLSEAELRTEFETNFFGAVNLTRSLLPALRAARGKVITVTSVVAWSPLPYYCAYAGTKGALEAFMESLYFDLRPTGVQVSLIEPGAFKTDFATRSVTFAKSALDSKSVHFRRISGLRKLLAGSGRVSGDPDRVAKLMVRLVEKRRIRLRYPIGFDAVAARLSHRFLPDAWRIAASRALFRLLVG